MELIANVDAILSFLLMFLYFVDVCWDGSIEIPKALESVVMTLSLVRPRMEVQVSPSVFSKRIINCEQPKQSDARSKIATNLNSQHFSTQWTIPLL